MPLRLAARPGMALSAVFPWHPSYPQGVDGVLASERARYMLTYHSSVNPTSLCVPSQRGLWAEAPQRHSVTLLRVSRGCPSRRSTGIPPLIHSGPSGVTAISLGRSGSTISPSASRAKERAPDGHRSTIAMIWSRTCVSSDFPTIFQIFVTRLPQKPACVHRDRSSLTTIFRLHG